MMNLGSRKKVDMADQCEIYLYIIYIGIATKTYINICEEDSHMSDIEKMYAKLKEYKVEADADALIDKSRLDDSFDTARKVIKWLNKKTDWVEFLNAAEGRRKAAYRKAYEYYKTDYNIKLNTNEEYRMMIESDATYCEYMEKCNAAREIIKYIEEVVTTLRGRSYEVNNLSRYIMWQQGHID